MSKKANLPDDAKTESTLANASMRHVDRLMRLAEVLQILGLSPATIYRQVKDGSFPAPLKISKRRVAWRESDIRNHVASRQRP